MYLYQVISYNGTKKLPLYDFHQILLILLYQLFAMGTNIFHRSVIIGKKITVTHFFCLHILFMLKSFTEQTYVTGI